MNIKSKKKIVPRARSAGVKLHRARLSNLSSSEISTTCRCGEAHDVEDKGEEDEEDEDEEDEDEEDEDDGRDRDMAKKQKRLQTQNCSYNNLRACDPRTCLPQLE